MKYGCCLGLWVGALLAGCSGAGEEADGGVVSAGESLEETATVAFQAGYQQQVSGALQSGKLARVVYDSSRLTTCRGSKYGKPAWAISGHYRIGDGPTRTFTAVRPLEGGGEENTAEIDLYGAGELQLWFENTSAFGCQGWDSAYGQNYRFTVVPSPGAPGWMGNEASVIARVTCDGGPCDGNRRPLTDGFSFDTWARQRAAITSLYFDVWKQGVTDLDNPALWQQLDVRVYYRFSGQDSFAFRYVPFARRVGNDARYAVSLRELDPLFTFGALQDKSQCPPAALSVSADGFHVRTEVEYFFEVNGVELRPGAGLYRGVFENDRASFEVCLAP